MGHQGNPGVALIFEIFFRKKQGIRTRTCSVVLRVFRALEAREPHNLFFACVRTHTCVCACGVSVEYVGCVRQKLYPIKKKTPFKHYRGEAPSIAHAGALSRPIALRCTSGLASWAVASWASLLTRLLLWDAAHLQLYQQPGREGC